MKDMLQENLAFGVSITGCVYAAIEGKYYYPIVLWTLVMVFQRMPDKLRKAEVDVKDGKIDLEEDEK
jgi:hypothetical protein